MDESRAELLALFDSVDARQKTSARPVAMLIGGWAVYAYNPYYGSTDIDIMTTSALRQSLISMLGKRGYSYHKDAFEDRRLCKRTDAGPIQVDFFSSRTPYKFEGRTETIKYDFLYFEWKRNLILGVPVPVPSRTALLVTKLKAAWDRNWRLENKTTFDAEYEHRKLVKDYSDIIALVDKERGGKTLDLEIIGGMLHRFKFLRIVLDRVEGSIPAAEFYGTTPRATQQMIKELVTLL